MEHRAHYLRPRLLSGNYNDLILQCLFFFILELHLNIILSKYTTSPHYFKHEIDPYRSVIEKFRHISLSYE